jgi:dTMP kinase
MNGLFITIEGIEGCGKSTQIKMLAGYLREKGYSVVVTREPGGTPLAERIRGLLMENNEEPVAPLTELFLYEAARAQHVNRVVLPRLRVGRLCCATGTPIRPRPTRALGVNLPMILLNC